MNEKEKDRIEERFDGFETSLNSLAGQMGTMGRAQEGFYQRHEERSENIKDDVKEIKTDIKVIHTDISGHETSMTVDGDTDTVLGTAWTTQGIRDFTVDGGTVTYTGTATSSFTVLCHVSYEASSAATLHHALMLNGSTLIGAPTITTVTSSAASNDGVVITSVELSTNDTLDIQTWADDTETVTHEHLELVVEEF